MVTIVLCPECNVSLEDRFIEEKIYSSNGHVDVDMECLKCGKIFEVGITIDIKVRSK